MNTEKISSYREQTRLWNLPYILILVVSTLSGFSFYMIATIMSDYLVGLGTTIAFAGFVVGLFSITSLCCRPFCGMMADRWNNTLLLVISNILMAIGLFGFAVTDNMALMVFFRIINGIGFSINGTVQVALIVNFIPKDRMGEGIGYIGISQLIGSACAPAFGMSVADFFGSQAATFMVAALLPVLSTLMLIFIRKLEPPRKPVENKSLKLSDLIDFKALPYTMGYSTFSFTNGVINGFLVLYAKEVGIENVKFYFTLYAFAVFLIRPLSGKIMDRKGLRYTVFPGMIICACSLFFLGFTNSLWAIFATGIFRAIGQGAAQPSLQAGCINYVGIERRGVATSTYFLGGDIGQGVGPMIGGVILAQIAGLAGYRILFSMCGVVMLAAMVYFGVFCKKENIR